MVIIKATPSSEAGELPSTELLEAMGKYNEALVQAGIMKAGEGLKPSSQGQRVRFRGDERIVTDGPFVETRELIAGFWLWEVESMDDALQWVRRCPNPMKEEAEIEIRPVYGIEDFASQDPDGKVARQETELANTIEVQASQLTPYLFFSGRCEEAIALYQQVLGASVEMMMRFSESPEAIPQDQLQPGFEDKIMHATLRIGHTTIMCSDGCDDRSRFQGFRLAITLPSEAACHRVFDALAAGGQVDMPLTKTFWSPCYGMVTDPFEVGWMIMMGAQP